MPEFKGYYSINPILQDSTRCLTFYRITALPKRLGTHIINCVCHVERSETSLYVVRLVGH